MFTCQSIHPLSSDAKANPISFSSAICYRWHLITSTLLLPIHSFLGSKSASAPPRSIMTVNAIHIFDRKGKTLFTKRYSGKPNPAHDAEQLSEQRKLIFGMLFSLRELVGSLTPEGEPPALHSVKTGAGTLHCYETISGMRIALYTSNNPVMNVIGARAGVENSRTSFQAALKHIYSEIWVECVVRSPLYRPGDIQVDCEGGSNGGGSEVRRFDIKSTNFEQKLDAFLQSMPWFR